MKDHYSLVPTDYEENMEYRESLEKQCLRSSSYRATVMKACREDILYFFSSMVWLFEPRLREHNGERLPQIVPFIPWPHQVDPIRGIRENLGKVDIAIDKSRAEGASWILILMALHDWLFVDMAQVGMVSSKEANVDIQNNVNTLFGKMDWELKQLPVWMTGVKDKDYHRNASKHTLFNARTDANITGYAATSDVASGSRALWFGFDELAKFPRPDDEEAMTAVQAVTDSRFVVSTPLGSSGAYYELMHEPSNMKKYILSWENNPTKNRGLYRMKGNRPIAVSESNPLPENYDPPTRRIQEIFTRLRRKGFALQGNIRSPWFDNECDRPRATPQSIAQELSRDFGGSQANVFSAVSTTTMAETIRDEMIRGNISYHPETLKMSWERVDDGESYLWCPLDSKDRPPEGKYVIGIDVAVGDAETYTSNSVMSVINVATREQVFEWAANTISPVDFADLTIVTARWFHGAHIAWEQNGPGGPYSRRLFEQGYDNLFRRTIYNKRSRKKTKEYGFWMDVASKEILFADIIQAVVEGELVVRSKFIREEAMQYVRFQGRIEHCGNARKGTKNDGTHGDRVVAIAIAVQAMKDMPMAVKARNPRQGKDDIKINSLAWREEMFAKKKRDRLEGIDLRTLRELMH